MKLITAAAALLMSLTLAVSSASAATEHFANNTLVADGTSRYSAAHGSGTNRYSVFANGLNDPTWVCVRIDGESYICSGNEQYWTFTASGLKKGWAFNGTGHQIRMNAHMTYGE